jgi:hypothetical protein
MRTGSPRLRVTESWKRFAAAGEKWGHYSDHGFSDAAMAIPETK